MEQNKMLSSLFNPPSLDDAKCVLCVQPHSDDNEIGMGATIKKLADKGCEIHYLTITDGRLGTKDVNQDLNELVEIRHNEAKEAGKVLGVMNFHFFNYKDGTIKSPRKLSYKIAKLIRELKTDYVFVCDPYTRYEAHLDHIYVGQAVSQAVLSCSLSHYPEKSKGEPFEVKCIGYYFTENPNTFVNIEMEIDFQLEAMKKHKSQLDEETFNLYKAYLINKYSTYGEKDGNLMAQGLKLLSPLHIHCISDAVNI
jgi:LmbE family N-acetylglucosaminyl deacetylase